MAGYAMGFDGGGAIPDDDSDSYTPPADGDQAQAQPQAQQPSAQLPDVSFPQADRGTWTGMTQETPGQFMGDVASQAGKDIGQGVENLKNSTPVKRIVGYLTGGDAAAPAVAAKFAQGVKAENPNVTPDDANMLAVQKAFELGGPEAGWAMVQYNRQAYNAKQAFARAALVGVPGKPADPHAVAQAATQASQNVLDGSQAVFTPTQDGKFTATVKMPGSNAPQTYTLDPKQMYHYLDVGNHGQWDRLMETGGVPAALQKVSSSNPSGSSANPRSVTEDPDYDGPKGSNNNGGEDPNDPLNYGSELEKRSHAIYGYGNVNADPDRVRFMQEQENLDEDRQAKIKQAEAAQKGKLAVAHATGDWHQAVEGTRQQGANGRQDTRSKTAAEIAAEGNETKKYGIDKRSDDNKAGREQKDKQFNKHEADQMARSELGNPNAPLLKPGQNDQVYQKWGVAPGQNQPPAAAAQPKSNASQVSYDPKNLPPAEQRHVGATITTGKGTFRWTGSGWAAQ